MTPELTSRTSLNFAFLIYKTEIITDAIENEVKSRIKQNDVINCPAQCLMYLVDAECVLFFDFTCPETVTRKVGGTWGVWDSE
jgi:hypothetical protein